MKYQKVKIGLRAHITKTTLQIITFVSRDIHEAKNNSQVSYHNSQGYFVIFVMMRATVTSLSLIGFQFLALCTQDVYFQVPLDDLPALMSLVFSFQSRKTQKSVVTFKVIFIERMQRLPLPSYRCASRANC